MPMKLEFYHYTLNNLHYLQANQLQIVWFLIYGQKLTIQMALQ